MEFPVNESKRAVRQGKPQIGLWLGLADSMAKAARELAAEFKRPGLRAPD